MDMTTILGGIFILFAVYSLAASSGLFAERSGTINLSINGGMIMGAIGYVMTSKLIVDQIGQLEWWVPLISLTISAMLSILITSLLSVAAINFRGDHIIVGTAINILAPIISLVILISITNGQQIVPTTDYQVITVFPAEGSIKAWEIQAIIFGIVSVIILGLFLLIRKTTFGLRLRAAGENPHALAAAGVSVYKIRHFAMLISGALAGIAGGLMVCAFIKVSSYQSAVFGMGFIALAILILGQWRLPLIIVGAIVFSVVYTLAFEYGPELNENQWYIYMVPYISILITLPFFSMKSNAPKAEGIPYVNTGR